MEKVGTSKGRINIVGVCDYRDTDDSGLIRRMFAYVGRRRSLSLA
jgi:hypothetical protein